jgi:hypothetical protein
MLLVKCLLFSHHTTIVNMSIEVGSNLVITPRRLKLKWSFNLFNPWQSFKVSRLINEFDHKEFGLRKRVVGCWMCSLFSRLFDCGHCHRRD